MAQILLPRVTGLAFLWHDDGETVVNVNLPRMAHPELNAMSLY